MHELLGSGEAAALRRRAGLSQRDIASLIGSDHTTVGRWERRQRTRPRGALALRYAKVLARLKEWESDQAKAAA